MPNNSLIFMDLNVSMEFYTGKIPLYAYVFFFFLRLCVQLWVMGKVNIPLFNTTNSSGKMKLLIPFAIWDLVLFVHNKTKGFSGKLF